ncbi:uncharacterized protein [Typha angustifolia]|uniref:uncharacterized protein n=1 Tax=Typha angustifolia TaxID=59011 RepID=UPI003C2B1304
MASLDSKPSEISVNVKRRRSQSLEFLEDGREANSNENKKPSLRGVWENLDLVLSLQSKDIPLPRKIELSFDFVSSEASSCDRRVEPVQISRLVSFLGNWIQNVLISSNNSKKGSETCDSCLDYRCWVVLRFCLGYSVAVSPNLLRAVTRVARHALLHIDDGSSFGGEESAKYFMQVLECLSLLLSSNGRAFYNATVELWISLAVEIVNLVRKVFADDRRGSAGGQVLFRLSICLLEQFAIFLRFYPNPKNIFRVFVDRLLDPSLELLVLLHSPANSGNSGELGSLLKFVEDVLSNGLFHPVHISGFFSLKSLNDKLEVRELMGIKESYHRHLLQRFKGIKAENKAVLLGGFGYLLQLFVSRVRNRRGASLASKGTVSYVSGKSSEASEEAQETNKPLFEVFVQFMEPLLVECKECARIGFSGAGDIRMLEIHCILKSVNETLTTFIQEKIYVRTEDNSEGSHYKFLQDVYDTIISMAGEIYKFWLSTLHVDDASIKKMLPLIAREVFVAVGYFLEIEYKVVGDDIIKLWQMMFSFLAVNISSEDTKPSSLLVSEILNLGSLVINIFSELRQVNYPIFGLSKAVRLFILAGDADAVRYPSFIASSPLSSQMCLESLATLLSSQVFRTAICSSIKSMPERQTSGCIEELKVEVSETLKWMRSGSFMDESLDSCGNSISSRTMLDFDLQAELLGRVFSELYTNVLDSLTVTATNSILVGNSVENLMKEIRPSFSCLLQNQSDIYEFVFSLTGTSRSNHGIPECGKRRTSLGTSWAVIFFFRLYTSCRSLNQQLISLMPPDSARKASELMGNLFDVSCGMEWSNRSSFIDGGYFSWIVRPSCTLLDVIQHLSEAVLTGSYARDAPLVYILHIMVFQRLNNLNRQIRAFSFLQEGDARRFKKHGDPDRHKASKRWKQLLNASRQEAAGLTKFVTDYMSLLFSEQKWSIQTNKASFPLTNYAWDLVVSSLNEISLPIGIWCLLCWNIDIWCLHASKKDLKDFFSHLLRYSLGCQSTCRDVKENITSKPFTREVTLHNISLGLLHDTVLYDQTVLSKHFVSRFCDTLKRSFSPVVNYAYATDLDLNSLPNWSEILNALEKEQVVDMDDHLATKNVQVQSSLSESDSVAKNEKVSLLSFGTRLRTCESLLSLLRKIPGVHVNAKSFSRCATHILHIERLVVSNLLRSHCESFICNPLELFRLFVSCRKALSYLITTYKEGSQELMLFSVFSTIGDSSSVMWLLKSVHELIGLPHALFGEFSDQVKSMMFSLVDHTSNIFSTVSNGLINHAIAFLKNNEELIEPSLHDDPDRKGTLDEDGQQSDISKYYAAWKNVELILQTLENRTRNLPVTVKGRMHAIKLEDCFGILCWNKISSTVSCLQGFLWGLVLALDSICKDKSAGNLQSSKLLLWYASKLGGYISIFENFVDICMYVLLVGSTQGAVDVHSFHSLQDLDSDNGFVNLDVLLDRLTKCFACQVEHVHDNHPNTQKQARRTTQSASNHNDDNTSQSECECINLFRFEKERLSGHASCADNIFSELHNIDFSDQQHLNVSLLKNLLKGKNPLIASTLRELFMTSAAILKLRCLLSFPRNLALQKCSHFGSYSMGILVRVSHIILQEMAEMNGWPDAFSFVWIDGILRYLEVVGSYFTLADPYLSKEVYSQVINSHMKAIGKCISLQGKIATLSSHETGSNTKNLRTQNGPDHVIDQNFDHRQYNLNAFKSRLRMSLKTFIGRPLKLHMKTAIQAIERALVGVQQGCHTIYNINTGNIDGGEVSSVVAAGIDCFNLILESHSGYERVLKKNIPSLIGALLNIILHLQSPIIFYIEKLPKDKSEFRPDAGAVILMCIEVLTTVVGRHTFQMDICHVSQCLHIPVVLFRYFHQLKASRLDFRSSISYGNQEARTSTDVHQYIIDRQLSIDLYAACCKLIWITLKHRIREIERCIALVEDSVTTLLNCLELVDSNLISKEGYFSWEGQEALKCASFFRRIYEEIRQQKDVLGRHSFYFLSSYISIYSGYGPLQRGIKREIDEALRPGVYSLIDICTSTDLQQLHTVLGEGPCRSTLANLLHDYRLHFQYGGKI